MKQGQEGRKVQIRFVGIFTSTIATSLCLLFLIIMHLLMVTHWCYPSINLNLLCTWEKFILSTMLILGGGGIISLDHCITAWLVNFCTYSKSKHRAFNTVGVLIQFINFKNVSSTNQSCMLLHVLASIWNTSFIIVLSLTVTMHISYLAIRDQPPLTSRGRGHVPAILSCVASKIQIRQWFVTS